MRFCVYGANSIVRMIINQPRLGNIKFLSEYSEALARWNFRRRLCYFIISKLKYFICRIEVETNANTKKGFQNETGLE